MSTFMHKINVFIDIEFMQKLRLQFFHNYFILNYGNLELHNILVGMCLEEAYGGGQGTLKITIKKDGEMAGTADIDYVG